jgi:hypothetical protein
VQYRPNGLPPTGNGHSCDRLTTVILDTQWVGPNKGDRKRDGIRAILSKRRCQGKNNAHEKCAFDHAWIKRSWQRARRTDRRLRSAATGQHCRGCASSPTHKTLTSPGLSKPAANVPSRHSAELPGGIIYAYVLRLALTIGTAVLFADCGSQPPIDLPVTMQQAPSSGSAGQPALAQRSARGTGEVQ